MEICQLCGEKSTQQMSLVLPWGATCASCVKEIEGLKNEQLRKM